MQAGLYLFLAMIFLLGWWTEREARIKAENKISRFYKEPENNYTGAYLISILSFYLKKVYGG